MTSRHLLALILGTALVVPCVGCSARTPPSYDPSPPAIGESGLHAVQDARLREVMREMLKPTGRLPQELAENSHRRSQMVRIAELAADLEKTARHIPDVLADVSLTEDQSRRFRELSELLARQSARLHAQAEVQSIQDVRTTFEQITETCESCHRSFRVLPALPGDKTP